MTLEIGSNFTQIIIAVIVLCLVAWIVSLIVRRFP